MKQYSVYFLKSKKDKGFYIGCTSKNLEDRLAEHNSGMVKSTKSRRPYNLFYFEKYASKRKAFKREWFLKHPSGYKEKLKIIKENLGV